MKKSLIALLVVVALVVTVSAFSVSAEETVVPAPASADYTLTITDGVATAACPCEEHKGATATFTAWTAMPTTAGHYYLADDYSVSGQQAFPKACAVVLHLNGHTYKRANKGAAIASHQDAVITILDNPANEGSIQNMGTNGANAYAGTGGVIILGNPRTTLNIYGGTYTNIETTAKVTGGIIGITQATNTVNIYGGVFEGGSTVTTDGKGGAFGLTAGTLNIYGGTIQNCQAYNGGSIYATGADSEVNIYGGTIKDGTCKDRGGNITLSGSAKATISGGTITGGTVTGGIYCGGNIYAETGCLLTVNDGALITKGKITTAGSYGGGNIGLRGTGQMVMNGGTISEGQHAGKGGNIFKENGGKVTLNGGTVTAGISGNGANIYAIASAEANRPTVEIKGANITDGDASNGTCGGVYISGNATLTMTAGSITGGTSKYGGGNIRTNGAACIVNISGGSVENGTVTAGDGGNLFSNTAATINITGGSFIGGTASGSGANVCITNASATSVMKNATISGGTTSKTSATVGATLYLSSGNFTEISGMTFVGGSATGSGANAGGVLITTGNYTIENCTFTGGSAYGNGGALCLTGSGTTTLENCTITGGIARYGANLYVSNGTVNLVNTNINKCGAGTLINGGGVCVNGANAIVNMDADSVITNNNVMHGGNVAVLAGTFNLNGGTISAGKATRNSTTAPYGGNVYVKDGKFNMNSGLITGGIVQNTTADVGGNGGNIYISGGEFILNNGTITLGAPGSANALKGPMNGGNVYMIGGKFTMNGGTVSEGTAKNNGSNFYVTGIAADAENDIVASGATLDINGGTISGGTAATGGSIYIDALAAAATIDNATISGGKATSTTSGMGGGNIWNALGTTTITKCTISDGVAEGAQGGNIFNKATGLTVDTCRIENGVAGKRVETEGTDTEGNPTVTVTYPNGNGRGGNYAQVAGSATFNYCVIKDGVNYSTTGGGGNIYLNGTIGETKFDGCTITDGFSQNNGGNIQHHAAGTVIITGDSYIAGGTLGANFGANISVTNGGAILKIDGETEINATGCTGYGAHGGINIHVEQPNAKLYLLGDSRVILGTVANYHSIYVRTIVRSGSSGNYTYTNGTGKVYLGGNAFMDKYVELFTWSTTQNVPADFVEVMEGFTGDALLISVNNSNFATADNGVVGLSGKPVNFGAEAPAYLSAAANYANTGTVKVHSQGRSGYVTVYNNGVFTIAPYTAFIAMNNGAKQAESSHVEVGLANFDTLPAGTGYVKLYTNTALTLNENLDGMPIDLNNQVITIDPNGYTLAPIDYRTDGGDVKNTKLTVAEEDEANIQLLVKNPVTNYQYLNVKGDDGKWTSNRIRVEMTKVSIRPSADGIYYTTRIVTNANAAPALVDFGTAVSLVNPVDENFLDDDTVLYTSKALNVTGAVNETARSALITGILAEGEDNDARGKMKIYANSYVTAMINGNEVKIMADESYDLSLKDIMIKLDAKVTELHHLDPVANADTINGAVTFYKKWDVFATWGLTKLAELAA